MGDEALLEKALRDLADAWRAAEEGWRDAARDGFHREFLAPLEARAGYAVKTLQQFATLIEEAERTCQ
jgi:hypothetical protein